MSVYPDGSISRQSDEYLNQRVYFIIKNPDREEYAMFDTARTKWVTTDHLKEATLIYCETLSNIFEFPGWNLKKVLLTPEALYNRMIPMVFGDGCEFSPESEDLQRLEVLDYLLKRRHYCHETIKHYEECVRWSKTDLNNWDAQITKRLKNNSKSESSPILPRSEDKSE